MRMTAGFAVLPLLVTLATLMSAGTVAVALLAGGAPAAGQPERESAAAPAIEHALAGFLAVHGRLPCPDSSDPRDGWEDCGGPGGWPAADPAGVPFRTLGLPAAAAAGFRYLPSAAAALPNAGPAAAGVAGADLPADRLAAWRDELPGASAAGSSGSQAAARGLVDACARLESLRLGPERSVAVTSAAGDVYAAAYVLIAQRRGDRADRWFQDATISGGWPEQISYSVKENRVLAMTVRRLETELACSPLLQSQQSFANALAEAGLLYRQAALQAASATRPGSGEDDVARRVVEGFRHYELVLQAALARVNGVRPREHLELPGQGGLSSDETET